MQWKRPLSSKRSLAAIVLSLAVLAGCSEPSYTASEEKSEIETLAKQATGSDSVKPVAFEELMKEKLDRVSKDGANELIDLYLFTVFGHVEKMEDVSPAFQAEMKEWVKEKKDITKQADIDSIENTIFKAYVEDLREANLTIVSLDETFAAQPNYDAIEKEYGMYMKKEMKRYLEICRLDMEKPFYDTMTNHVDLDILADRIIRVVDMQKDFPESLYNPSLKTGETYYREVFFGAGSDLLFGYDDKVNEETLAVYRKYAKSHKDHAFGKEVQLLLDLLKQHQYTRHAEVEAYIEKLTQSPEPVAVEEKAEKPVEKEVENKKVKNDEKEKSSEDGKEKTK